MSFENLAKGRREREPPPSLSISRFGSNNRPLSLRKVVSTNMPALSDALCFEDGVV